MRGLLALLMSSVVWAQLDREEPDSETPSDEPTTSDVPDQSEEPTATRTDEEPAQPTPAPQASRDIEFPSDVYGAGMRLRYVTIPHFLLSAFTEESTSLHSWAIAGEFVWWRRAQFALLSSLEIASYSANDGNFLGNGEDPAIDTDYVQFRGLKMVSMDASFVWEHEFTPKVALIWGAGVGLMFPAGEIVRASSVGCTAGNAGDETQCLPAPCRDGFCTEDQVNGLVGAPDPHGDPRTAAFEQDLWPVYPLLNLLVGVRFTLHRHFQGRVDMGFHNAFFLGVGSAYLF